MTKNKLTPRDVDPEDISGRMFSAALNDAFERVGRNSTQLARQLGLKSRVCQVWLKGLPPPYKKMQEIYYKLLKIDS